jgi:hypothetical protein
MNGRTEVRSSGSGGSSLPRPARSRADKSRAGCGAYLFSVHIFSQHIARPVPDVAESMQHPSYRLVAKCLVQMLPQLILQQGHGPTRSVIAVFLCRLHSHQFLQELVDRAVRAAGTPCVSLMHQSNAAACTAETGYPATNALARHMQRLRHLADWLTTGAFQYSKPLRYCRTS